MTSDKNNTAQLAAWIEPEIRTLPVEETANNPGSGADGGGFADCTLS